ncbi:MAG: ABC transporter permease [Alicyclobacillus sp.]|nr:ABC transporter permease [Alicyclobacillus sp.]
MGYVLKRFGISVFIIFVVVTASFFMIRLMPGNAVDYMYHQLLMSGTVTPQQAMNQVQGLYGVNLKEPLIVQYVHYLLGVLHGQFGSSTLYPGSTVMHILANAIPWTVFTVSISLLISFALGSAIGTIMAYFRKHKASSVASFLMTILNAVPNYIIALLLLYWLAFLHQIFPTGGAFGNDVTPGWNLPYLLSVFQHAILPIAATVITSVGGWALGMKSSVVGVLGEEYITAAKSRGLTSGQLLRSYVGRNAILPLATSLGLSIGFMFGGNTFIETMFNYPGLGYYLVNAVNGRDYPLMMGSFILTTTAVVLANWLTDLMNGRLDPRSTGVRRTRRRSVGHAWSAEAEATTNTTTETMS